MSKKAIQYSATVFLSMIAYSCSLTFFPVSSFPVKELISKVFSFFVCLLILLFCHNKNNIKGLIGRAVSVAVGGAIIVSVFDGIYSATKQVVLVCVLTATFWLIVIGFFVAPLIKIRFKNVLKLLRGKRSTVIILSVTLVTILLTYSISAYRNINIGITSENMSLLSYLGLFANQLKGASMMIVDLIFITLFFGLFTYKAFDSSIEK